MRVTWDFTQSMEGIVTIEDEFRVVPGKRHRTRCGLVTDWPVEFRQKYKLPVKGSIEGHETTWHSNGRWLSSGRDDEWDLVAVVEDGESE